MSVVIVTGAHGLCLSYDCMMASVIIAVMSGVQLVLGLYTAAIYVTSHSVALSVS